MTMIPTADSASRTSCRGSRRSFPKPKFRRSKSQRGPEAQKYEGDDNQKRREPEEQIAKIFQTRHLLRSMPRAH